MTSENNLAVSLGISVSEKQEDDLLGWEMY